MFHFFRPLCAETHAVPNTRGRKVCPKFCVTVGALKNKYANTFAGLTWFCFRETDYRLKPALVASHFFQFLTLRTA